MNQHVPPEPTTPPTQPPPKPSDSLRSVLPLGARSVNLAAVFLALVNWYRANPQACEDFCTKIGGATLLDAVRTAA